MGPLIQWDYLQQTTTFVPLFANKSVRITVLRNVVLDLTSTSIISQQQVRHYSSCPRQPNFKSSPVLASVTMGYCNSFSLGNYGQYKNQC